MGEWSDYFEAFPEENPANWVDGRFDPAGATRRRAHEAQSRQVAEDSKALPRKMFQMAPPHETSGCGAQVLISG
jgi:hypothetical protein